MAFNGLDIFFMAAQKSRYSSTIISGYRGGVSGRYPISCLDFWVCGVAKVESRYSCPVVGMEHPDMMRIVVDFPAPLGPRNPTTSPSEMEKDNDRTA